MQAAEGQGCAPALAGARDNSGALFGELLPWRPPGPEAVVPLPSAAADRADDSAAAASGGWSGSSDEQQGHTAQERPSSTVVTSECGIDVVEGSPSAQQFLMKYLAAGRPLLMRGAAKEWSFRRAWARCGPSMLVTLVVQFTLDFIHLSYGVRLLLNTVVCVWLMQ